MRVIYGALLLALTVGLILLVLDHDAGAQVRDSSAPYVVHEVSIERTERLTDVSGFSCVQAGWTRCYVLIRGAQ